jgi:hypothetical protein
MGGVGVMYAPYAVGLIGIAVARKFHCDGERKYNKGGLFTAGVFTSCFHYRQA